MFISLGVSLDWVASLLTAPPPESLWAFLRLGFDAEWFAALYSPGVGKIQDLATGIRMCGIKTIPIITMIPSLVLIFPLTRFWIWLGL